MQTYPRAPSSLPIPIPPTQPLSRHAGALAMPSLSFPSGAVTPSEHVASGTSRYTILGYAAVVIGVIVACQP